MLTWLSLNGLPWNTAENWKLRCPHKIRSCGWAVTPSSSSTPAGRNPQSPARPGYVPHRKYRNPRGKIFSSLRFSSRTSAPPFFCHPTPPWLVRCRSPRRSASLPGAPRGGGARPVRHPSPPFLVVSPPSPTLSSSRLSFRAIPHNSKCRYGERGAADAKPKAQIILCVLSSILATQMPCRSCRSGA